MALAVPTRNRLSQASKGYILSGSHEEERRSAFGPTETILVGVSPLDGFVNRVCRDEYDEAISRNTLRPRVREEQSSWSQKLARSAEDYLRVGNWGKLVRCRKNREVIEQIEKLKRLEADWNGYGAEPINPRIIESSQQFIRSLHNQLRVLPQVVPMTQGRLQLEWHDGTRSLELEFESPSQVHYLKWDSSIGLDEEDIVPVADQTRLRELIEWFATGAEHA